jgi:hypothetical protein
MGHRVAEPAYKDTAATLVNPKPAPIPLRHRPLRVMRNTCKNEYLGAAPRQVIAGLRCVGSDSGVFWSVVDAHD